MNELLKNKILLTKIDFKEITKFINNYQNEYNTITLNQSEYGIDIYFDDNYINTILK